MSDKPFSQLVRRARRERRLSQQDVASALGVRQNTISAWERGIQLPAPGEARGSAEARLQLLAEQLGLEPGALLDALMRQTESGEFQAGALDADAWQMQRRAFLEHVQHDQCEVWVFATDHLPAERDPAMAEQWIGDIRQGVTYHMVWLIDLIRPDTIDRSARALWEMAAKIRTAWPERPGIVHYPTTAMFSLEPKASQFGGEDVRYLEQVRRNYETYAELASEGIPKNAFKSFTYVSLLVRHQLLKRLAPDGPVELLLPRGRRIVPLSGACHQRARVSRTSEPAPAWLLHDRDTTYELVDLANAIRSEFA